MSETGGLNFFVGVETDALEAAAQLDAFRQTVDADFLAVSQAAQRLSTSIGNISFSRLLTEAQSGTGSITELSTAADRLAVTIERIKAYESTLGGGARVTGVAGMDVASLRAVQAELEKVILLRRELSTPVGGVGAGLAGLNAVPGGALYGRESLGTNILPTGAVGISPGTLRAAIANEAAFFLNSSTVFNKDPSVGHVGPYDLSGNLLTGSEKDPAGLKGLYAEMQAATKQARIDTDVMKEDWQVILARAIATGEAIKLQGGAYKVGNQFGTTTGPITNEARIAQLEAQIQAGGSGFFGGFGRGFVGSGDGGVFGGGFGEQAGWLARYYAIYQGFRLVEQTIKAAAEEAINFDRQVTNLALALGDSRDNAVGLANALGNISAQGGLSPSAGVQYGAQYARVFQGQGPIEDVAKAGATAATQLAVLGNAKETEKDVKDVVATIQSFNLNFTDTSRVLDAATSAAQNFGFTSAETILPGLAAISDLAKESGFSLEQTANIIAAITSRTGETSDTAAGELRRILGREGQPAFQQLFAQYGVSAKLDFAQQVQQLSQVYQGLDQQQQGRIVAQFGGGRAGVAAQVLLAGFSDIQAGAEKSMNAAGIATDQYNTRLNDLRGQLEQLHGIFREFAKDLGESGVGAGLGAIIVGLRDVLTLADDLLKAFDAIPAPLREGVILLGEMALLGKLLQSSVVTSLIGGAGGLLARGGGAAAGAAGAEVSGFAAIGAAGAAGISPGAALLGRTAGLLGGLVNPVTAAVATLIVIGGGLSAWSRISAAADQAGPGLDALAHAVSNDDFLAAASNFGAAATGIGRASRGFFGTLGLGFGGLSHVIHGEPYDTTAQQYNADLASRSLALELARRSSAEAASAPTGGGIQGLLAGQDLTTGLASLKKEGVDAADRLRAVAQALGLVADNAKRVAPGVYGTTENLAGLGQAALGFYSTKDKSRDEQQKYLTTVTNAITTQASTLGISPNEPITDAQRNALIKTVLDKTSNPNDSYFFDPKELAAMRLALLQFFLQQTVRGLQQQRGPISGTDAQALEQASEDVASNISPLDITHGTSALAGVLKRLNQAIARGADSPETLSGLIAERDKLLDQFVQARVGDLEAMRRSEQQKAHTDAQIKAVGKQFLALEVQTAINDPNQLVAIFDRANRAEINLFVAKYKELYDIARAAAAAEAALVSTINALPAGLRNTDETLQGDLSQAQQGGSAKSAAAKAAEKAYQNILDAAKRAVTTNVFDTGSDLPGANSAAQTDPAALARAIAEAAAYPSSKIEQAQAALAGARAGLANAGKDQLKYYQALKELHDAEYQYAQAVIQDQYNARLLSIDITDPVAQARAKLRSDAAQLNYDRGHGAPGDVIRADQVQYEQDQAAAERAAFDQRLHDAQTNYELGRISGEAYLRYLENQHDYLTRIAHRTRQQQDELNEIDQALQAAKQQLQGQFNIGNIRIPTIYEVRRVITAQREGSGYVDARQVSAHVDVHGGNIDAVVAAVVAAINGELGTSISASGTYARKTP